MTEPQIAPFTFDELVAACTAAGRPAHVVVEDNGAGDPYVDIEFVVEKVGEDASAIGHRVYGMTDTEERVEEFERMKVSTLLELLDQLGLRRQVLDQAALAADE